jgi:UvrD/REP helicase N-terminal domain
MGAKNLSSAAYLAKLNAEQRAAVEHGVAGGILGPCPPLLIIAGAGSGKTNTLAHRVVHLIVNGADPNRLLLMTFSRRAAAKMIRRVERIAAQTMGQKADILTTGLAGAGRHIPCDRCSPAAGLRRTDRAGPGFQGGADGRNHLRCSRATSFKLYDGKQRQISRENRT